MEAIIFSETVTPKQRSHGIVCVHRRSYVLVHAGVNLTQLQVRTTEYTANLTQLQVRTTEYTANLTQLQVRTEYTANLTQLQVRTTEYTAKCKTELYRIVSTESESVHEIAAI
jgi:hypothetical protein